MPSSPPPAFPRVWRIHRRPHLSPRFLLVFPHPLWADPDLEVQSPHAIPISHIRRKCFQKIVLHPVDEAVTFLDPRSIDSFLLNRHHHPRPLHLLLHPLHLRTLRVFFLNSRSTESSVTSSQVVGWMLAQEQCPTLPQTNSKPLRRRRSWLPCSSPITSSINSNFNHHLSHLL